MPSKEWGEIVFAVLVVSDLLEWESFRTWCRTRLSNYKIPNSIQILAELPTNNMGKVDKKLLKKLLLENTETD